MITLISSDNVSYEIDYNTAVTSETLKLFIEGSNNNTTSSNNNNMNNTNVFRLPIKARLLEKCIEFMKNKIKNKDESFAFKMKETDVVELMDVAAYLRI